MTSPCFDPRLARSPTRRVPVAAVLDPLHRGHWPARVAVYRAAMLRGERFPPVAVLALGSRYLLADGHKRLQAYRGLDHPEIVVEVWPLRRWLADQWRQFTLKSRQQWDILRRLPFEPAARREGHRLLRDTLCHWWRVVRSLATLPGLLWPALTRSWRRSRG